MARGRFANDEDEDEDEPEDEAQARLARTLAAAGLVAEGRIWRPPSAREDFALWPECVPVWRLWCALQTQWRVGFAGATGMDYPAALALIDRAFLRPRQRREAFDCIRGMERAALEAFAEARDKK